MARRSGASMTPEEARLFHEKALVIDSQQPGVTSGLLYTEAMHEAMRQMAADGMSRGEIRKRLQAMTVGEIRKHPESARQYMAMWEEAGVNVASATYAGPHPPEGAFETSIASVTQARAIIDALGDELRLVLKAADIEAAYRDGARGVIFDFQETMPFGTDLDRIDTFYNLGLRVVQLTYNLRNLVGDGCTERYKTGLTYFGIEVVRRLNDLGMLVDVSHSSEQVGFDAIEVSSSPVIVTHSASNAVCYHDRGKGDELARAIADNGGFFGVAAIGGFLRPDNKATLDDFVDHVEHLVDVMGIDHVGIGSDKCGRVPARSPTSSTRRSWDPTRPRTCTRRLRIRGRRRMDSPGRGSALSTGSATLTASRTSIGLPTGLPSPSSWLNAASARTRCARYWG